MCTSVTTPSSPTPHKTLRQSCLVVLTYKIILFLITENNVFHCIILKELPISQLCTNHRQILAIFLDIKNERAYLVGGAPGKLKNIFEKILGRESMRWQSFVQAGLG
jgi:hypothetical protein